MKILFAVLILLVVGFTAEAMSDVSSTVGIVVAMPEELRIEWQGGQRGAQSPDERFGKIEQWEVSHESITALQTDRMKINTESIEALKIGQARTEENLRALAEKLADIIWLIKAVAGGIILQLLHTLWKIVESVKLRKATPP